MDDKIPPFQPHRWLRNGHLQTLGSRLFFTPKALPPTERLFVEFADQDRAYFDLNLPQKVNEETPVIALFHGLCGCSESSYMLRFARKLTERGWRSARFSHRGAGTLPKLAARQIYHVGSMQDVAVALQQLIQRFPKAPLVAIGYSLSGSILLNMLGRTADLKRRLPNLEFAATVSAPLDLEKSSRKLSRFDNVIYDQYFSYLLRKQVERRKRDLEVDDPKLDRLLTLRKFDEQFTARVAGYRDRNDYYSTNAPHEIVSAIELPTLVVAAADDPIIHGQDYHKANFSTAVKVRFEQSGGHVGFVSSDPTRFNDNQWLDEALMRWLEHMFPKMARVP